MKPDNDKPIQSPERRWSDVLRFFPLDIRNRLALIPHEYHSKIMEIRLRINQPLEIIYGNSSAWLAQDGSLCVDAVNADQVNVDAVNADRVKIPKLIAEDFKKIINAMTSGSFYALEDEVAQGYIALPGGHRVGITGHVVHQSGKIRLIRNFSSINFRIARQITGIAQPVLPFLLKEGRILKTLILSAPACGKTTLLREIIREVSYGCPQINLPGMRVGLVDERSEIAGCYQGAPQLDVGSRTDILDGCPKKEGVYLLLRTMNPQLIATDEIGTEEDFKIIEDIINAGVSFIATAHALNLTEALCRPGLKKILELGMIERLIFLSNRMGVGTIESIKAGIAGPDLYTGSAFMAGENK